MKNESLAILKSVSSKLANCKGRVPASKLIGYVKHGRFGYSETAESDTVITNDSVFADEVQGLIAHLRGIFKEPYINLERQNIVQNVSVATQFDNRSLQETYLDEGLWRVRNGVAAPEFIHTYVNEENLVIYENRFICFLIDLMFQVVSKKLSALHDELDTFNAKIDSSKTVKRGYSVNAYVGYNKQNGVPVLATLDNPVIAVIGSLTKSKTELLSFKNTELYASCQKAGNFDYQNLKKTNILTHAANYNFCYEFFMRYLASNKSVATQDKMYFNYGVINLFRALESLGFSVGGDIVLSAFADIKLDGVCFANDIFEITAKKKDAFAVELTITEKADGNYAKYLLTFVDESVKKDVAYNGSLSAYVSKVLDQSETDVYGACVITNEKEEAGKNIVFIDPVDAKAYQKLADLISSYTVLAEGVDYIHSRRCAICGSKLVSPDGEDVYCSNCGCKYHIFAYAQKQYIWFKRLPEEDEEQCGVIESEEIVKEETAVSVSKRPSIKKSFFGKLSQGTVEQKQYYNAIKNALLSYKRVNSRISWNYDAFNLGREKKAKIAFSGKTLVVYFALDAKDYEGTKFYPHDKKDIKKYEETPMMIKVKSERGKKHALELIDILLYGLPKRKDYKEEEFSIKYMSDKKLIEEGLAKKVMIKEF